MTDTTNTSGSTGQNEKQKVTLSIADLEIRDYFASKALQGLIASANWIPEDDETEQEFREDTARVAYVYANAMLRAREGHNDDAPDMLAALETVFAGGHLTTGEQAIVANAIAKATGKSIDEIVLTTGG